MEAVEENPGTATLGDLSFEREPAKHHDPDGKILGDNKKASGSVENNQENGARVSTNGKDAFSGDLGGGFGERVRNKVVSTRISAGEGVGSENLDASGVEAKGLEDSEMNGVSSLLKMRQDFGEKENGVSIKMENARKDLEARVGSSSETKDGQEEEIDDTEHKFHVGDFVWGKIKSHPWWPGQIYDSSDASDLALKIKQKGTLLVACFGDGTFAWCQPSQLKPFAEKFKEFSKMSSSRSFTYAVKDAVEEMGRQVALVMSSSFVSEEHLDGICRPVSENAGIKQGVLVPEVRKETISCLKFEPEIIIRDIRNLAKGFTLSDLLEYEMLERKVSAFYRAKGGHKPPEYYVPQRIPGLEDEYIDRVVKLGGFKTSSEEDWIDSEKPNERSLEKGPGFPEDRLYHRKKQKSIAEILEADRSSQAKGDKNSGSVSFLGKKRKGSDEAKGDSGDNALTSTTPRRRKISELSRAEDVVTGDKEVFVESPKSRKRKNRDSNWEKDADGINERKEKNKGSGVENNGDLSLLASLGKKIKIDVSNVEKDENNNGETNVQTPNDSLSRERRRSKYLSPPYTTEFSSKWKKNEIEAGSVRVPSQALVGEYMTNVGCQLIEANQEKPSKEPDVTKEIRNDSCHQMPKGYQREVIDFSKVKVAEKKLMDLIQAAALRPQYAEENSSLVLLGEFISVYRSFTYHDGSNNKIYKKQESVKEKDAEKNGKDKKEGAKARKKKGTEPEKPILKQQTNELDSRMDNSTVIETQVSNAELVITFGPGSSLPSKDDLIRIYGKFGPVNKERSDMCYNKLCARIAFLKLSDAEEAFNSSQNASPFVTSSKVSFRLRYFSASPKNPKQKRSPVEERTKKKPKNSPSPNPSTDAELSSSQTNYVKEKLEVMRLMLEKSEGRMSVELKSKLEIEMGNLLEKVSSMVVSPS